MCSRPPYTKHKTKTSKTKKQQNMRWPPIYTRRRQSKQKHNTICVWQNYTQTNTNNVKKTWSLLQTTGCKDEPNNVLCGYRNGHHNTELRTYWHPIDKINTGFASMRYQTPHITIANQRTLHINMSFYTHRTLIYIPPLGKLCVFIPPVGQTTDIAYLRDPSRIEELGDHITKRGLRSH
jgi:hypothetical protein